MESEEAIRIIDGIAGSVDPAEQEAFDDMMRERYAKAAENLGDMAVTSEAEPDVVASIRESNPELFTISSQQAADVLGVSLASIRRWADEGQIGHMRTPSGQRRFSIPDLKNFIAGIRVEPSNNNQGSL